MGTSSRTTLRAAAGPLSVTGEVASLACFEKYCLFLCILLVAAGCVRIVSTYDALSLTVDEPFHLACAIGYWSMHSTTLDVENPPIARAVEAIGPYLAGARLTGLSTNPGVEGAAILASSKNSEHLLFLYRLGTLPFFVLACLVVGYWSYHFFGKPVAVFAVGLFTLLPTTLSDAGLGTTDMALASATGAAFVTTILWAEKPTWGRAVLTGGCTALASLSKFSALGYLTVSLSLAVLCYWSVSHVAPHELIRDAAQRLRTFLLAAATFLLLIWAAYWFSVEPVHRLGISLPAPGLFHGFVVLLKHNRAGHLAFLLGRTRQTGWWYYFPVALAVKTPIAFLILAALGIVECFRRRERLGYLLPLVFIFGVLLPAMTSRINIGIRHIAPIYLGLSIVGALGLKNLIEVKRCRLAGNAVAVALVGWMTISVALHHPDYLAYFNEFAGKHPENILVDSNYDWGQDLKFLSRRLGQLGAQHIALGAFDGGLDNANIESWYGVPEVRKLDDSVPSSGWTAISSTFDKLRYPNSKVKIAWYDRVAPTERVGTFFLYYLPPAGRGPSTDAPSPLHETTRPPAPASK